VVHVAEVEETAHPAGVDPWGPHDHVVVVRVTVDHPAPKAGESGHDLRLVASERPLDERAMPGVGQVVERAPDPGGTREVPREVAVCTGMLEVRRAPSISPRTRPRSASSSGGRGRASASVVPVRHVTTKTRRGAPSGPGTRVRASPAVVGRRGQGQVRGPVLDVPQGRALQLDESPIASGVHGLQHEEAPVRRRQAEVVVELPGSARARASRP